MSRKPTPAVIQIFFILIGCGAAETYSYNIKGWTLIIVILTLLVALEIIPL